MGWVIALLLVGGPSDGDVDAALRRVLASDEYQSRIPRDGQAGGDPAKNEPRDRAGRVSRYRESDSDDGSPPAATVVGTALLWVVGAVSVAVLVLWLVSSWNARRRDAAVPVPRAAAAPGAPPPEEAVPDADVLAGAGHWDEAVHALLLRFLRDRGVPEAWTSRDALRRLEIGDESRQALARLVGMVEVSRFGGQKLDPSHYRKAVALRDEAAA